ncbi:MAG: hypothetical protein COA90_04620 [Gammaproteobacteria bacterium]|nr:MAG: hypothetical protein COA90_04620 [Gammaproteobacteria bacterium]
MTRLAAFKIPSFLFFLSFIFLSGCNNAIQPENRIYQKISPYDYEDTLMNLDIAISEHNYRIIHRSNIGQAIRDRGDKDYPLSTVISFCNISYAKEMIEINSDLLNDMPCIVTVQEQQDKVIIGTRLMKINSANQQQNEFAQRINNNLTSIVESAIE